MSENEQDQQTDDVKGIRAQLEQLREENKALKSDRRQRAYADAGLPEGAYDIFDKTYDGELSADALRSFAESKGFRLASTDDTTAETGGVEPEVQRAQQESQARLDQVDAARLPTTAPDLPQQIMEATAAGDWDTSRALKHQLLNEQRAQNKTSVL